MSYEAKYTETYFFELKNLSSSNPKLKSIVKKAIPTILADPFKAAKYIKELGCHRKHIAAKKYRILYKIEKRLNIVYFQSIRIKNKRTYL